MEADVKEGFARIELLLENMKESLEREMRDGFAQVTSRFDTQSARLDRHAGYWQTGRRWSGKMEVWAEKIDTLLEAKDRQIADLRERVERLEQKP
jgi:DNA-binding GntR family transcriptional regulator